MDIKLISQSTNGAGGNNTSHSPSISADGRYVVFYNSASNLVAGDTNGYTEDIFLYDTQTGVTTLVTPGGNHNSYAPSISADGRYVAFESNASNLVAGDTNANTDIFLYDTQTGVTTLVTPGSNSYSFAPSISADGRYVAFDSNASNLVAGDTNIFPDIFLYDTQTGVTTLVTPGSDDFNGGPSISADGRYVAFQSSASNLVAGDTNGYPDIFLYDTQTGVTTLVTPGSNGFSDGPSISADGRYVAFQSSASNLVAGDTNGIPGIFLYDTQTGVTTLVTPGSNGFSDGPSISADGRYVAFESYASNLVAGDTNGNIDIFLYDTQTGVTTLVTPGANNVSENPQISADGSTITFDSFASNLVAGDTNSQADVFVVKNPLKAAPADLNNDGLADILWRDSSGANAIWEMNAKGGHLTVVPGNVATTWQVAGIDDFNNDGYADILWRNNSGAISIWEFNAAGGHTSVFPGGAPINWQVVGTGDFNNDGYADILWRNNSGAISIWEFNAAGGHTSVFPGGAPTNWQVVGTGDFNNDGYADILWRNNSGAISIWEFNAAGGHTSVVLGGAPTDWKVAAVGDYSGDGYSDILWRNPTTGANSIWEFNVAGGHTIVDPGGIGTAWQAQA